MPKVIIFGSHTVNLDSRETILYPSVLKLEHAPESPGGLDKLQIAGSQVQIF